MGPRLCRISSQGFGRRPEVRPFRDGKVVAFDDGSDHRVWHDGAEVGEPLVGAGSLLTMGDVTGKCGSVGNKCSYHMYIYI